MSYPVFRIAYQGMPRDHHALFIEFHRDGSGQLFHVKGDIQRGMEFETRATKPPEQSATFTDKKHLGWIYKSDVDRFEQVCLSNPPPEKQFNGPKRLDPTKKLRRCQEWTAETIQYLRAEGILHADEAQSASTTEASGSKAGQASKSFHSSSEPRDGSTSGDGYWTYSAKYKNWYHVHSNGQTSWAGSSGKGKSKSRS